MDKSDWFDKYDESVDNFFDGLEKMTDEFFPDEAKKKEQTKPFLV